MAVVVAVGEPVPLGIGGTFARAFATDGGWTLFWAAGGDLNRAPMSAALVADESRRVGLTGRSDLQDHAIARCPDGSWLHVASFSGTEPDDSAAAWRYAADFSLVATAPIAEDRVERRHNDLPVVCSDLVDATASFQDPYPNDAYFIALGADGAPAFEQALHWANVSGASFAYDAETDTLVVLAVTTFLQAGRLDGSLMLQASTDVPLPALGDATVYWPQGLVRAGPYWIVAHMARPADGGGFDGDSGDVWLEVLDRDFAVLESVPVATFDPPAGAMRPGLAVDGDTLLVTYDRDSELYVTPVTLDLPDDPGDTGTADTAADVRADTGGDDDEAPGPIPATRTCGCGGGSAFAWLGIWPILVGRAWRR